MRQPLGPCRVDEGFTKTAGQRPDRREDLVEAEPEGQLAEPPATCQEHWFDHRQLLPLYHRDEHCAIYVDPDVRWAEVGWLPRFIQCDLAVLQNSLRRGVRV